MLDYFYTRTYEIDSNQGTNPPPAKTTTAFSLSTSSISTLIAHVEVYIVASLYDVSGLKKLSAKRYKDALATEWHSRFSLWLYVSVSFSVPDWQNLTAPDFVKSIQLIYQKIAKKDRILYDEALKTAVSKMAQLRGREGFVAMCKENGEISWDIFSLPAAPSITTNFLPHNAMNTKTIFGANPWIPPTASNSAIINESGGKFGIDIPAFSATSTMAGSLGGSITPATTPNTAQPSCISGPQKPITATVGPLGLNSIFANPNSMALSSARSSMLGGDNIFAIQTGSDGLSRNKTSTSGTFSGGNGSLGLFSNHLFPNQSPSTSIFSKQTANSASTIAVAPNLGGNSSAAFFPSASTIPSATSIINTELVPKKASSLLLGASNATPQVISKETPVSTSTPTNIANTTPSAPGVAVFNTMWKAPLSKSVLAPQPPLKVKTESSPAAMIFGSTSTYSPAPTISRIKNCPVCTSTRVADNFKAQCPGQLPYWCHNCQETFR